FSGDGAMVVVSLIEPLREGASDGTDLVYSRPPTGWQSTGHPNSILEFQHSLGRHIAVDSSGDTIISQYVSPPGSCPYARRARARRMVCGTLLEVFQRKGRLWPAVAHPIVGLAPLTKKY